MQKERFVARRRNDRVTEGRIEEIGSTFFEDVVGKHFQA